MIGCSKRTHRTLGVGLGVLLAVGTGSVSLALPPELPKAPTLPEIPEAPKVPEMPKAPEVPEIPELPGGGGKPAAPKGPMRKVLDHKKKYVVYPRLGYLKVLGNDTAQAVDHLSIGGDLQLGIKRKGYISIEANLLAIQKGVYGVTLDRETGALIRYGESDFTSLVGVGGGLYTSLLDKQEFWTHVGLKVGYLHPFYLPIWLGGDIEKEFRRTRGSYWTFSAAPAVGMLIPLREPVSTINYAPAEEPIGAGGLNLRFFAGIQLSVAYIFGPRS